MNPKAIFFFVVFSLVGCASQTQEVKEPTPTLAGRWQSQCFSPGNGQGARLTFDLTASAWELDYDAFGDASCANKNLTVHIEGGYTLGEASKIIPGGIEARFDFGQKTVTPHNEGAAAFLAQACGRGGFAVNQASDLSGGCAGLGAYPMKDCPSDYDVVLLSNDTLHFGARPADNNMCSPEKRPTAKGLPLQKL